MTKVIILLLMIVFAINAISNKVFAQSISNSKYEFMFSKGIDSRSSSNPMSSIPRENFETVSVGLKKEMHIVKFERGIFQNTTKNGNIQIESSLESLMLAYQIQPISWKGLSPYVGVGLGTTKSVIDTEIGESLNSSSEGNQKIGEFELGLAYNVWYFGAQAGPRIYYYEKQNSKAYFSFNVQFGLNIPL